VSRDFVLSGDFFCGNGVTRRTDCGLYVKPAESGLPEPCFRETALGCGTGAKRPPSARRDARKAMTGVWAILRFIPRVGHSRRSGPPSRLVL